MRVDVQIRAAAEEVDQSTTQRPSATKRERRGPVMVSHRPPVPFGQSDHFPVGLGGKVSV